MREYVMTKIGVIDGECETQLQFAKEALEAMLLPESELAHMLDSTNNYELSEIHHKRCIKLIEQIKQVQNRLYRIQGVAM